MLASDTPSPLSNCETRLESEQKLCQGGTYDQNDLYVSPDEHSPPIALRLYDKVTSSLSSKLAKNLIPSGKTPVREGYV
jgi:hypothetical protein